VKKTDGAYTLDGRDVPETSANLYIEHLKISWKIFCTGRKYRIASGGGPMSQQWTGTRLTGAS
jgi:hypothetical protein